MINILEASLDDEIVADLNSDMLGARLRNGTLALGLGPGHDFEIENVEIVEVVFGIAASEDDHFGVVI